MSLFDLVFGCGHKRYSFPITVRGKVRRSTAAASVNRDLYCLPRLRPRVPVRLVADEDARFQTTHCGGGTARHHLSWSQGGLRPVLGPSRRANDLRIRSGEHAAVSWAGNGSPAP
jgi:hypothetical protein